MLAKGSAALASVIDADRKNYIKAKGPIGEGPLLCPAPAISISKKSHKC